MVIFGNWRIGNCYNVIRFYVTRFIVSVFTVPDFAVYGRDAQIGRLYNTIWTYFFLAIGG